MLHPGPSEFPDISVLLHHFEDHPQRDLIIDEVRSSVVQMSAMAFAHLESVFFEWPWKLFRLADDDEQVSLFMKKSIASDFFYEHECNYDWSFSFWRRHLLGEPADMFKYVPLLRRLGLDGTAIASETSRPDRPQQTVHQNITPPIANLIPTFVRIHRVSCTAFLGSPGDEHGG
jgi:hypothetical protein